MPKTLIFPIVSFALCLVGLAVMFILKKTDLLNKFSPKEIDGSITANEFVNVKDIKDKFLYTRDNQIIMYIKIEPVSIDLYSKREKEILCRRLTAELSSEQKAFKFIAVSRPVDISPLISEYSALMKNSNDRVVKDILKNEMLVMSSYAESGDVVERQFYFMFTENYKEGIERDLSKRVADFASKFKFAGILCEIMTQKEIVRLCNLIDNPAYSHIEDMNFEKSIPTIIDLYSEEN